jgi:hypothetical protein
MGVVHHDIDRDGASQILGFALADPSLSKCEEYEKIAALGTMSTLI